MTTITQDINDLAGVDDNTSWTFYTEQIRLSSTGTAVVSTKKVRKYPVAGVLTVQLDPGPAVVAAPDGKKYPFTVPGADSQLWPLIEAAVALPPTTSADQLAQAIGDYLAAHPVSIDEYHEYANLAAFPSTGVLDRLHLAKDTNFLYRWSGSAYIQVGGGAATEWEEYANLAAFPGTGDTAKEYVAVDTGKIYRWNGSAYVEVSVGEPTITAGTTAQYWRGDKSFQTLNQDVVPDGTTNKAYSAADKTRLANTSGTNTGDQTSVSGNAGTATALATARNINGVAFDGTANITVNPPLASVGVTQLSATGTPSSSTYLRGDNTWSASAGGGGITRSVVTVTSSVTVGSAALTDYVTLIGAGGAPILPTAVGNTNRYTCKNIDTTNKTVATTSSQTIDGSTTVVLTADTSLDFISDGSNWRII